MNEFIFSDIFIGQEAEFKKVFIEDDVLNFIKISGDRNPLHLDNDYASRTEFGGIIIQGMLSASLFSALVGMYLPGKYCLYLSQDIQFRKPARIKDELTIRGRVVNKVDALKILEIETTILNQKKEEVVSGVARVRVIK